MRGDSPVVSLNKYLIRNETGIVPTHHWLVEVTPVVDGFCTHQLKQGTTFTAHGKTHNLRECWNAWMTDGESRLVWRSPDQQEARGRLLAEGLKDAHKFFHRDKDWFGERPFPIFFHALTLGHGLDIATSLTPQGGIIKLVGCDGTQTGALTKAHVDLQKVVAQLKKVVPLLRTMGPGWEILNCNP
eukprot:CAMPEP_0175301598 /NCGR_PEP_ID=MMETSP0093-20121207/61720_1 /TAXON_ID=311494 /ORGANISM="Alexandrium monilatum, Strain CCMP3105" /LENGTH=185 /DNA_ID=CAMNT_0016597817 /DNA_START=12 /DNA_END=564 /DNA_ORIENTATION=+